MGDATERLAVDRWLDGEHGWLGLCDRLGIGPPEASSMRRAATRAALDALETVRLRRRAESGEALAVELLAERVALRVDPLGIDEKVVARLRAMAIDPSGVQAEQQRRLGMEGSRIDAAMATLEGWRSGTTDAGDAAMRLRVLGFGDLAEAVAGSDRRRRGAEET